MLKTIEPKSHSSHQDTIDSFLDMLYRQHGMSFDPEILDKATFFIENGETSHSSSEKIGEEFVYGGAILYPQKIPTSWNLSPRDRSEKIAIKLGSAFQVEGDEYWTARICFNHHFDRSAESFLMCFNFYIDLISALVAFGKRNGIDTLAYTYKISETYNTKAYEAWPYQLGISTENPWDDFAHGILSLTGQRFRVREHDKEGRNQ